MTSLAAAPAAIKNDFRLLARCLSLVENDHPWGLEFLRKLEPAENVPVIGFTGPPGAGKSTLINAIVSRFAATGKRVAILAIDPTSPFNFGSLLGDRIRMRDQFNSGAVFIRSLATRGSLGGLSAKAVEMTDVLRSAGFDYIFVETVGVGQSEVEVAGLADCTLLLMVPGSGDEIQLIKSGIIEIADAVVINKSDLEGATALRAAVKRVLEGERAIPVFSTTAESGAGTDELVDFLFKVRPGGSVRKKLLLAEKAWKLIESRKMAGIDREALQAALDREASEPGFNLYRFIDRYS